MKTIKKIFLLVALLLVMLSLASCAVEAPYVGENGNWFVDGKDTGISAKGEEGDLGPDATGFTVDSVEQDSVSADGLTVTYKVTLSTGTSFTFDMVNGGAPDVETCEEVTSESTDEAKVFEITFKGGFKAKFSVRNGKDGKDGTLTADDIEALEGICSLNIISSSLLSPKPASVKAESLSDNESLTVKTGNEGNDKQIIFRFSAEDIGEGSITLRQGEGEGSSYIVISKSTFTFYTVKGGEDVQTNKFTHNLTYTNGVYISIHVGFGKAQFKAFSTSSNVGFYERVVEWSGVGGDISVTASGSDFGDVELKYFCDGHKKSVYVIGDFGTEAYGYSWAKLYFGNGYDKALVSGDPHMTAAEAILYFEKLLSVNTPRYAVWCVGMNDHDSATEANVSWIESTEKFLEICEEKGITPILVTLPEITGAANDMKNDWVVSWAGKTGRYIKFASAIGSDNESEVYTDGNLNQLGAEALYMQLLIDFPELLLK